MEGLDIKIVKEFRDLKDLFYLGEVCNNEGKVNVGDLGEYSALARINNEAVGFWYGQIGGFDFPIDFGIEFPCFYSKGIFVLEEFRGRGIGSALKMQQFEFAKEKGCRSVYTTVQDNSASLRVQDKLGVRVRPNESYCCECCFDLEKVVL